MRLIIDCSNIYHRAYWTINKLKGFDLSLQAYQDILARKFVTDILSICRKFDDITEILLCFDGSKPFRKGLSPTYKATRSKMHDNFYFGLNNSTEIFKNKGFNVLHIHGLEADDLIALSVESNKTGFNILVSNDVDIRTLVDDNCVVFTANSKNYKIYCNSANIVSDNLPMFLDIAEEVDPILLHYKKLLLGCNTDNVASLLPLGHGDKKVEKIYQKLKITPSQNLIEILSSFNYSITEDQISKQNSLVKLSSEYMPKDKVDQFLSETKNIVKNNHVLKMEEVLSGTIYMQTKI